MTKLERDHHRFRRVRDLEPGQTLPLNEDYPCPACGAVFFMATSLRRHRETEIPAFIAESQEKREAWEASRVRYRATYPHRDKSECE